jgi:uncharacterized delta-60 repeat protein
MMKWMGFLLVVLVMVSLPQFLQAQPDTLWTMTYGGIQDDYGRSVVQTTDGCFVIAGRTRSYGAGYTDVYLMKINANGDTLWTKTYGGISYDGAASVAETYDGGFIVAGWTESYGAGRYDVYLLRTDSNGDSLWTRFYGGTDWDCGTSVVQTTDGGFIATGYTDSGPGGRDVWVLRTDANGDTLWTRTYGGPYRDYGWSIIQLPDGGFIIAGDREWPGHCDVYLIRTDAYGDSLWTKTFGGNFDDAAHSIKQVSDGGFIIAGRYSYRTYNSDVCLIRIDCDGDILWQRTYGGEDWDYANSVIQIHDGGYVVVGATFSFASGDAADVYVVRTDSQGDSLWTTTFGEEPPDGAYDVVETQDGGYLVIGNTGSYGSGGRDVYVIRFEGLPSLSLASAQTWVPKKGTLDFRVSYDNLTQDPYVVDVVFEVYKPDETEPTKTFASTMTLDPGFIVKHYALTIPAQAPIGPDYLLKAMMYYPSGSENVISRGDFRFEVTPAMAGVPLEKDRVVGDQTERSEGEPDTLWTGVYGGCSFDEGWSVAQASDGGYLMAGWTQSYGAGEKDFYLVKTDPSGDTLLTETYGGTGEDWGWSVAQISSGGYIVAGLTDSYGAGLFDVYLIKTDSAGSPIWAKTYGGTEDDYARTVIETNDGGYILVGFTKTFSAGDRNLYLIRTNADGDTLWTRSYGGSGDDWGFSVVETPDEGFVAVGWTQSYGAGDNDAWLVRVDADGGELWSETYGGANSEKGLSVVATLDGGYLVGGYTESYGAGGRDVYLVKVDSEGQPVWNRTYGLQYDDVCRSLARTSDGGYIVAGYTESYGAGGADVYLIKINAAGDAQWNQTWGGSGDDRGRSVVETDDGGFLIGGYTESYGACESDFYLVRLAGMVLTPVLVQAQSWVPRGGTLDFRSSYYNLQSEPQTVEMVFEAYLPGGPDPARTFSDILTFDPGWTIKYYALMVPGKAPIKTGYLWKAKAIDPPGSGEVVSWDRFEFEVSPAMEDIP